MAPGHRAGHRNDRVAWLTAALLALAIGGCGSITQAPGNPVVDPETPPTPQPPPVRQVVEPRDPVRLFQPSVNLTIYHFVVPAGTVSANEQFWKHADEHVIDIAAHDVLYKNGIRVGRGSLADMEYYMSILERQPMQTRPLIVAAAGARLIEIPLRREVPGQIIYDFDLRNLLTVRSYDDPSDNILCLEFQPAPRKSGDVRVSLVPMVRTLRKRLMPVSDLETREVEFVSPEKRYALNLRTDLPLDTFLVLAPSPQASAMSLGRAFFVQDGPAERLEDVLLIIPQATRRVDRPQTSPATAPAGN